MKLFILFVIIQFSCWANGMNNPVLEYYYQINKAELQIVNRNYKEAIISYTNIENKFGYLYGKDKLNLSICLLLEKDKKKATKYLSYLLNQGAKIDWLLNNSVIAGSYSKDELDKYSIALPIQYKTLIDSLTFILENDQNDRKFPNAYVTHKKEIAAADSLNIIIFNKIVADYNGIPNEFLTGFTDPSLMNPPYFVHILHQSFGVKTFDYSSLLLNEVLKGNINPHTAASLYGRTSGNWNYFGPLTVRQTVYPTDSVMKEKMADLIQFAKAPGYEDYLKTLPIYMFKIPPSPNSQIDSINAHRHQYGLDSIDEFKQKVVFQIRHPEFRFYATYKTVLLYDSKEKSDPMMKNYEIIQPD